MGVVRFRDERRCNFRHSRAWRQAGKTRTWWHPLLARLLDYVLATGYSVFEEVLVGKLPLRVDILLIRRLGGQLSEAAQRDLSALVPLLKRFPLIESAAFRSSNFWSWS